MRPHRQTGRPHVLWPQRYGPRRPRWRRGSLEKLHCPMPAPPPRHPQAGLIMHPPTLEYRRFVRVTMRSVFEWGGVQAGAESRSEGVQPLQERIEWKGRAHFSCSRCSHCAGEAHAHFCAIPRRCERGLVRSAPAWRLDIFLAAAAAAAAARRSQALQGARIGIADCSHLARHVRGCVPCPQVHPGTAPMWFLRFNRPHGANPCCLTASTG